MSAHRVSGPLLALALTASLSGGAPAAASSGQSDLAEVRRATVQYHDVNQAIADKYEPAGGCVPGMGFHYVNPALFGAPLDATRPAGLIYAPAGNGNLRLVAVEYFVVAEDQDPSNGLTPNALTPSLFGQEFDGPMPGHGDGGMPVHYDLHAYIWQANPAGTLSAWNEKITC